MKNSPKWCPVCQLRPLVGLVLCGPCGRSYDTAMLESVTTAASIRWAAKRARRFYREAKATKVSRK